MRTAGASVACGYRAAIALMSSIWIYLVAFLGDFVKCIVELIFVELITSGLNYRCAAGLLIWCMGLPNANPHPPLP